MRDVTEMVEIWVMYTDSVVAIICYEHTTNGISCELTRKNELSVIWSPTSYPPNTTHLSQRELADSVNGSGADIDTISVCSYTPWSRQRSYTQLIEELSRLREYLNLAIETVCNEYLMSFFMNSYTAWMEQQWKNGMCRDVAGLLLAPLQSLVEGRFGKYSPFWERNQYYVY